MPSLQTSEFARVVESFFFFVGLYNLKNSEFEGRLLDVNLGLRYIYPSRRLCKTTKLNQKVVETSRSKPSIGGRIFCYEFQNQV